MHYENEFAVVLCQSSYNIWNYSSIPGGSLTPTFCSISLSGEERRIVYPVSSWASAKDLSGWASRSFVMTVQLRMQAA